MDKEEFVLFLVADLGNGYCPLAGLLLSLLFNGVAEHLGSGNLTSKKGSTKYGGDCVGKAYDQVQGPGVQPRPMMGSALVSATLEPNICGALSIQVHQTRQHNRLTDTLALTTHTHVISPSCLKIKPLRGREGTRAARLQVWHLHCYACCCALGAS